MSTLSHDDCAADFVVRRQTRKRYPGACSLEFQNVMDIVLKCLLNWDSEQKKSLGTGMVGDLVAWNQTVEELADYIDSMICASYGSDIDIAHTCSSQTPNKTEYDEKYDKLAKEEVPQHEKYFSRHPQIFRNARNKYYSTVDGCLSVCNNCGDLIKCEDIPENFYRQQSSKRRVSYASTIWYFSHTPYNLYPSSTAYLRIPPIQCPPQLSPHGSST